MYSISVYGIRDASLYILLPGPSSVPITVTRWALPHLRLYYSLVRLAYHHTSFFASSTCWKLPQERHVSPEFRCEPLNDPAMVCDPGTPLTHSPLSCAALLASEWRNPWPSAIGHISGLTTFTCVMADHSPFLELCISRYLNIHQVQFWPGG
jgi:hypothetical protein